MGALRVPGAPYRHSETPWKIRRSAPRVGEHNDAVYGRELGVPAETLRAYGEAGIV